MATMPGMHNTDREFLEQVRLQVSELEGARAALAATAGNAQQLEAAWAAARRAVAIVDQFVQQQRPALTPAG